MKGRTRRAAADPALEGFGEAFRGSPRVAVYWGEGASHSWIWFTDLLERLGIFDARFVSHTDILEGTLDDRDLLLVGGGDTYAMAEGLGDRGAATIERFVREGGLYHGSCAGAYLVLSGVDLEPFTPFNLIEGDMLNVMREPPPARCLEHKYLAPYGEDWVFHPVYGEVELSPGTAGAGMRSFDGTGAVGAPLFGGPVLSVPDVECRLADYAHVTARAAFPWPREDAERLIHRKQAVAVRVLGSGTVVASGPHLEHPLFPRANAVMAEVFARHFARRAASDLPAGPASAGELSPAKGARATGQRAESARLALLEIKRQVSNARIVGFGLEKTAVTWKIGVKVWEPEKIRMFLDYAWDRLPYLEGRCAAGLQMPLDDLEALALGYGEVTVLAKTLKLKVESQQDSQAEALSLLTRLKELTASFLSLYLRLRLEEQRRTTTRYRETDIDG
ncbi:MAG: BPL-N domain-containing protein [Candidatus Geothermincolia bacterium]